MSETKAEYEGWAIVELFGHRRLIGQVAEVTIAGAPMLRIDVLTAEGQSTQYYGAQAIYAITPTTEETAKRAASLSKVAPVSLWELPAPRQAAPLPYDNEWHEREELEEDRDHE